MEQLETDVVGVMGVDEYERSSSSSKSESPPRRPLLDEDDGDEWVMTISGASLEGWQGRASKCVWTTLNRQPDRYHSRTCVEARE